MSDQYYAEINHIVNSFIKYPLQSVELREHRYDIPLNIAISRIDRSISKYKYSADKTRFMFFDEKNFFNNSIKLHTIVSLYPEEGRKTVIVFHLQYIPIFNNIVNRYAFGKREAKNYLREQRALIEKAIGFR